MDLKKSNLSVSDFDKIKWFYSDDRVRREIVRICKDKEAVGSFGGRGYAKRPDVLENEGDVLFFVKKGVTSFHVSEETWENPILIKKDGVDKNNYSKLRKGWDLVFDVDCESFELSKVFAHLIVKALEDHGVDSVTVKFSGNRGFHVAVPFEAFPKLVNGKKIMELFPDLPRAVCAYLVDFISKKYVKVVGKDVFFDVFKFDFRFVSSFAKEEEFLFEFCSFCGSVKKEVSDFDYVRQHGEINRVSRVVKCCAENYMRVFEQSIDLNKFDFVDSGLISPRHLFRCVYSFHEKSGLFSVPVNKDEIMDFNKVYAEINNVKFGIPFLERNVKVSCSNLFSKALEFIPEVREDKFLSEFVPSSEEVPFDRFPPCVLNFFAGVEDGNKRGLFYVINFLKCCGYSKERIRKVLYSWNDKYGKLRKKYLDAQIKSSNRIIPPPNCNNPNGFKGIRLCVPDGKCVHIRNPVSYVRNLRSREIKHT